MTAAYMQAVAGAALESGCDIVSAGTPAMNGTYPLDPSSQAKMAYTAVYIIANGRFPAKQATWGIQDVDGIVHQVQTPAAFLELMTALADYATELEQIIDGINIAATLATMPAQPVNIA